MSQYPDDRPPISPQLAMRVAIFGGVALACFAVIFFRLWFLQILSGDQYLAQANNNRVRDVVLQAPRGDLVDRNGNVLVDNRVAKAIEVQPQDLPPAGPRRDALYRHLGAVVGVRAGTIAAEVRRSVKQLPYASVIVDPDAPVAAYSYIAERQDQFPGVSVQQDYISHYPHGSLAAQLLGTVGQITGPELKWSQFRGVAPGTIVGQNGAEAAYDQYLRGRDGAVQVQVDAFGRFKGNLGVHQPAQGEQLQLSLDLGLQQAGEQALQQGIALAHGNGNPAAAAAFVAMDPRNGQILAMGSYPTFDPNIFAKPVPAQVYNQLNAGGHYPLLNRAIEGGYPTGSTFKPITAIASLSSGYVTPGELINDPGQIQIGNLIFHDAGNAGHGLLAMSDALMVSSDVYFYTLGQRANNPYGRGGGAIQTWAHALGLGQPTGVDLPGELAGVVPSAAWRAQVNAREARCERRVHHPCGYAFPDLRPWTVGDNVNLAVGQGDLLATPLQMATVYAAFENGGQVVRPHVGMAIQDSLGRQLQVIDPPPVRTLQMDPTYRATILDGLRKAASQPGGTSADVMGSFPEPVYGKTGTAQHVGQADQSWYVCFVPDPHRPIVVAVTIEQGGFGDEAAAPAARLILSQWFGIKKQLVHGSSKTL